jgi:hypothetical protein
MNIVAFSKTAIRLGEIVSTSPNYPRNDRVDAAQWLLPLIGNRRHEDAKSLGEPGDHYEPVVRAMASAVLGSPEAQEVIRKWNALVSPSEDAMRFVKRWAQC